MTCSVPSRRAVLGGVLGAGALGLAGRAVAAPVSRLKVTVLSTMLADKGIGEWGYSALVECDGRPILFDTGARPDTVIGNAQAVGVDLAGVDQAVLSHNHPDHTGGLLPLRLKLMAARPEALARVHIAKGFFDPWRNPLPIHRQRAELEGLGVAFVEHDRPAEIVPGAWVTGPVARVTDEHNFDAGLVAAGAPAPDVPDDQALVIPTGQGVVVITGCGHAGAVNIVRQARRMTGGGPVLALIGGLHLSEADDARIDWTGRELRRAGVRYLLTGHCTGIEATYRLRAAMGLSRRTAAYGAIGSSFTLGVGIDPKSISA